MDNYVVGFMFNLSKTKVALIRKNRPDWQKGLLNGIGGKNNEGEHSFEAMVREFEEETGYKTYWYNWIPIATLVGPNDGWKVSVLYAMIDCLDSLKNTTDEKIEIIDIVDIDKVETVSSLPWLIKMCFDEKVRYGEIKVK